MATSTIDVAGLIERIRTAANTVPPGGTVTIQGAEIRGVHFAAAAILLIETAAQDADLYPLLCDEPRDPCNSLPLRTSDLRCGYCGTFADGSPDQVCTGCDSTTNWQAGYSFNPEDAQYKEWQQRVSQAI